MSQHLAASRSTSPGTACCSPETPRPAALPARSVCGVFNLNCAQVTASFRRLGDLDATVACFGHGEPLTRSAAAKRLAATQRVH